MDRQHNENSHPEQYFETAGDVSEVGQQRPRGEIRRLSEPGGEQTGRTISDKTWQIPNPQAAAMVAGRDSSQVGPAPVPLQQYAPTRPIFHQDGTSANLVLTSSASPYGFNPATSPGTAQFPTGPGWQQTGQHLMLTDSPTSIAAAAPLNAYGYMPYDERQPGMRTEDTSMRFGHSYVQQPSTALPMGYSYNWNPSEPTNLEYSPMAAFQSPTEHESPPVSPLGGAGTGTITPSSFTSSSSGGQYPTMYRSTAATHHQTAGTVRSGSALAGGESERETRPAPKRVKTRQPPSLAQHRASFTGGSASIPPVPLLGGSSSSSGPSNVAPRSGRGARAFVSHASQRTVEKADDKKPRGSHNLVEKQYRNRLNAQFEGLMLALPENLRSQASGGEGQETPAADAVEKRPSKAEVLEMARIHIQSLEQERDVLVRDRDRLRDNVERLRSIYASQASRQAQPMMATTGLGQIDEEWQGEGGNDDDDDEEDEDDEFGVSGGS